MATAAKYIETVGRRKTSSARVRITPASKQSIMVNSKNVEDYFSIPELQSIVRSPLTMVEDKFAVTVVVKGGGTSSQAGAVRHGIARALLEHDAAKRTDLKKAGYLKRDPRAKERRKPGLKKARKSPQWSKR
jgi:small subunit ribosomal protein S9